MVTEELVTPQARAKEVQLFHSIVRYGTTDFKRSFNLKHIGDPKIKKCIKLALNCWDVREDGTEFISEVMLYSAISDNISNDEANGFFNVASDIATFEDLGYLYSEVKENTKARNKNAKLIKDVNGGGYDPKPVKKRTVEKDNKIVLDASYLRKMYIPLGHGNKKIYLYAVRAKEIREYSSATVNKGALLSISSLRHWDMKYPTSADSGKTDWDKAISDIVDLCELMPRYDPSKTRGRGAWKDNGDYLVNLGDKIFTFDNEMVEPFDYRGKHNYASGYKMHFDPDSTMNSENSEKILNMINSLNWKKEGSGYLFAGWIVSSLICGSLDWRSHIWLSGERGSGKSWVLKYLVKELLGEFKVEGNGSTTEAALRQLMQQDVLPIVFDEAEPDGNAGKQRMNKIIELARSSATGEVVVKGTSDHNPIKYMLRSSFLFASIAVSVNRSADISRITMLELNSSPKTAESEQFFRNLEDERNECLGNFDSRESQLITGTFRTRIIKMMPVINQNIKMFIRQLKIMKTDLLPRDADQLGTLLACSVAYHSDNAFTPKEIEDWCNKLNWEKFLDTPIEDVPADVELLGHILGFIVKGTDRDVNIYTCIQRSITGSNTKLYRGILGNYGIKYINKRGVIVIENNNPNLKKILSNTDWAENPHTVLLRSKKVTKGDSNMKFNGKSTRGYIEIEYYVEPTEVEEFEETETENKTEEKVGF